VFDPVKQRVKGTEAEVFLKKGRPQAVTVRYIVFTERLGVDVNSGLEAVINSNILRALKNKGL
jgi:hypothetical protein